MESVISTLSVPEINDSVNNLTGTSGINYTLILVVVILCFVSYYLYKNLTKTENKKRHVILNDGIVMRPTILDTSVTGKLMGTGPAQRKMPYLEEFPKVAIMPGVTTINGIAPVNPDITGKEWADVPKTLTQQKEFTTVKDDSEKTNLQAKSTFNANDTMAKAIYIHTTQQTPFPSVVPVPTMYPSPLNINVSKTENFTNIEGNYKETPETVDYITPIDGIMSKWSQFGPCSDTGIQEETRTCIHDGIAGGKMCMGTLKTRQCRQDV